MKIDIFNHVFPRTFFDRYIVSGAAGKEIGKRMANATLAFDLDYRFRVLDEFEDVRQVITLGQPPIEVLAGPDGSPAVAREANDGLAELVSRHPDRFIAFGASLPLNNVDGSLREMERAIDQLGAKGVMIYTNVAGRPLDAPEFQPLFGEAARRGVPVWLHPARGASMPDYKAEDTSCFEIWWALGWPYETGAAMARLVFSGTFDRHPDLKIITHHLGGIVPYLEGRIGYGWDQLGVRTSQVDYSALLRTLKKRPVDYFRQFHADTAMFGARAATRCGLEFFGADRVLFASDMPFDPTPGLYMRETIRVIESLDLSSADKDRIYFGNAERLLGLVAPVRADSPAVS
jgi:predicted TIM-barrel fold metal-dependent hydrolase